MIFSLSGDVAAPYSAPGTAPAASNPYGSNAYSSAPAAPKYGGNTYPAPPAAPVYGGNAYGAAGSNVSSGYSGGSNASSGYGSSYNVVTNSRPVIREDQEGNILPIRAINPYSNRYPKLYSMSYVQRFMYM